MIHTRCPHCEMVVQADYSQRGRVVRCPGCGQKFPCEALPWWKTVLSSGSAKPREEKAEGKHRHEARPGRSARVLRPYERVDESVLEKIPEHHHFPHLLAVGVTVIVIVIGIATVLLLRSASKPASPETLPMRPPASGAPGAASPAVATDAPKTAPAAPGAGPTPAPETPEGPRTPAYAQAMLDGLRQSGYREEKGAACGDAFYWSVAERPGVFVGCYPPQSRIICRGFLVCDKLPQDPTALEACHKAVSDALARFIADRSGPEFLAWLQRAQIAGRTASQEKRSFVRERRFGDCVVRVETAAHPDLGAGVSVELARNYKPSTEIASLPPIGAWADMRAGATRAEVLAFAGAGKLLLCEGAGEFSLERYIWPGNGDVLLHNGRVVWWKPPASEEKEP